MRVNECDGPSACLIVGKKQKTDGFLLPSFIEATGNPKTTQLNLRPREARPDRDERAMDLVAKITAVDNSCV